MTGSKIRTGKIKMTTNTTKAFLPAALFLAAIATTHVSAQQTSRVVKAVELTGLPGVGENAKGTLSVSNGNLHFVHGKATSDVSAGVIQEVVSGSDTQESVGKTVGTLSMAAPYGAGRFLSLFRSKIDTLTVEYCDADGALHGAIFTMAAGTAEGIKRELIAQGAHTAASGATAATTHNPTGSASGEGHKQ